MFFIVALIANFSAPSKAQNAQARIYVSLSAVGSNEGTSWKNAYTDLQSALNKAKAGTEIWVAKGVYKPTAGLDRAASFKLVTDGVKIYGGFKGSEEEAVAARDTRSNVTILSGDIGKPGDDSDNSYHVIYAKGLSRAALIDGLTVTAGNANAAAYPDERGGGLYCDGKGKGNQCSPTLSRLTFSGNKADNAGAMYTDGSLSGMSSSFLLNSTFSDNVAQNNGGAMFNEAFDGINKTSLNNVTFTGNTALNGGAIYNNAYNSGTNNATIENTTFSGNQAIETGGAIVNNGAVQSTVSPTLTNVTFSGNSAQDGGAMYNNALNGTVSPILNTVTFKGNSAQKNGGAIYTGGKDGGKSSPALSHVIFSSNSAKYGGAMYNNSAAFPPAVPKYEVSNCSASPTLIHVTFSGNKADNFGAAILNNGVPKDGSKTTLTDVIVWNNDEEEIVNFGGDGRSPLSISQSVVRGGVGNIKNATDGGGNLDVDPLFVQPVAPNNAPSIVGGNLALKPGSPALMAGINGGVVGATVAIPKAGTIIYVNQAARGNNSGSSWSNAFTGLDTALGKAKAGRPNLGRQRRLQGSRELETVSGGSQGLWRIQGQRSRLDRARLER